MKRRLPCVATMLALAGAMAAGPGAMAQSAGQWTLKAGVNQVTPKVGSGDVSAPSLPGTKAAVGSDTEPVFIITYGLSDHVSAELALGVPYTHALYGAGSIAGAGQLGTVDVLAPTGLIQYRFFAPQARLRPYLGLGLSYVSFQKETGNGRVTALTNTGGPSTTFSIGAKAAGTLQAGIAFSIDARWFADLGVAKTFLKTRVHYSTGQTQDMTLDPESVCIGIGYRF